MRNDVGSDRQITLEHEGISEIEEKKSIFIGRAKPIESEQDAIDYIKSVRQAFPDARHHVWAYRLLGDIVMRCSDDGEPQGSAGVPVLDSLKKTGVSNAVIVVTRYFGGILLGAGGLVRAYSKAAKAAIDEAHIVVREKGSIWAFSCSYSDYQRVLSELPKYGAELVSSSFAEAVGLQVSVLERFEENFLFRLREISGGEIQPERTGDCYRNILSPDE